MAGNANSGRKPLPAKVHKLRGNPSKLPTAQLEAEVLSQGVPVEAPPRPDFLTAVAAEEWDRIVADLVKVGLVSTIDRAELAIYCQAWADWKCAREKLHELQEEGFIEIAPSGYRQIGVWMQIANRAEERLRAAGVSFGMSPSARARLKIQPPPPETPSNGQSDIASKYF